MLLGLPLHQRIAVVAQKVRCTHGVVAIVLPDPFFLRCLVFLTDNVVAQRALVLNVQPLAQADCMEKVSALGDASGLEVLVANGAYVAVSLQLLLGGFIQGSDARDGSSAVDEHPPAIFGLAPDVEVCMDAHH